MTSSQPDLLARAGQGLFRSHVARELFFRRLAVIEDLQATCASGLLADGKTLKFVAAHSKTGLTDPDKMQRHRTKSMHWKKFCDVWPA